MDLHAPSAAGTPALECETDALREFSLGWRVSARGRRPSAVEIPERVVVRRAGGEVELLRQAACRATRDPALAQGAKELFRVQGGALVVIEAQATGAPAGGDDLPVYRVGERGPLAVATGQVHVRLGAGASLRARDAELRAMGFEIAQVPSWAPHSGLLRALGGGVAAALRGIEALRALDGVEAVEPELLTPAARK